MATLTTGLAFGGSHPLGAVLCSCAMPCRTTLGFATTLLLTGNAWAEPVYLDYSATPGCPSRDEFERLVQARTALVQFVQEPHQGRFFKVRAEGESTVAWGHVTSGRGSEAGSAREVASQSCGDVVAALALIVALAIDPRASVTLALDTGATVAPEAPPAIATSATVPSPLPATATFPPEDGATQPEPVAPTPAGVAVAHLANADVSPPIPTQPGPAAPTPSTIRRAPTSRNSTAAHRNALTELSPKQRHPNSIALGVGPRLGGSLWLTSPVTPLVSIGASLSAESTKSSLYAAAVQLTLAYARSAPVHAAGSGSATFEIWSAEFVYCPFRVELESRVVVRPCLALEGGQLTGTGFTDGMLDHVRPQNRPWGSISELARVQYRLSEGWLLSIEAGIGEPLGLYRFVFETQPRETRIARVPVLVPRLNFGLAWRFL